MINEEQMKKLFAQSNPVPDLNSAELEQVGGRTYLATLETRSSEMTEVKTRSGEESAVRPRPRRGLVVGATVAIVSLAVLGATLMFGWGIESTPSVIEEISPPPGVTMTADDFVGRWRTDGGAITFFYEDGTYEVNVYPPVGKTTIDQGTWVVEGSEFVWATSAESLQCAGAVGRYSLVPGEGGAVWMEVVGDDPCLNRAQSMSTYPLIPDGPLPSEPAVTEAALIGRWRTDDGQHVEFYEDGSFVVEAVLFARELLDQGTWELSEDELTWSSGADSPTCPGMVGTYTVEAVGDGAFALYEIGTDPCADRALALSQFPLVPFASNSS